MTTPSAPAEKRAYAFDASYAQRSLWFLDQLAPGSPFYNVHIGIRLSHVSAEVLGRAIKEIVRRHEALRTVFRTVEGEPKQLVLPELDVPLDLVDLSHIPEAQREEEAQRIASEEAGTPFDLSQWPLLRTRLLRLAHDDHLLLLTLHHIVCDDWSLEIFQHELSTIYEAYCAGHASPLPELSIQYPDYAEWEHQWLAGPDARAQIDYWRRQLKGVEPLRLPTDRASSPTTNFEGADFDFEVPPNVHADLRALSRAEQISLFMTVLPAFQTFLHRYSGQEDIVVGTPVANRNRRELQDVIGFFANSVTLRADFTGDPTFRELLRRVRPVVLDGFANSDLPFEQLVRELGPERAHGPNPLFSVHFQLFSDAGAGSRGPGALDGEISFVEATTVKFDLALDLSESPAGLWGHLEYRTDLWDDGTIARWVRSFLTLLEAAAADPDRRVSELSLLDEAERRRILKRWNSTSRDDRPEGSLADLFEAQVRRTPEEAALIYRGCTLRYRELDERAAALASWLHAAGAGPETVVGVCGERSPELVAGILGVLKAGAAFLPLNPMDPPGRLNAILADCRPSFLLASTNSLDHLPEGTIPSLCIGTAWTASGQAPQAQRRTALANLAYVIYTSGSTGRPKGVQIEHRAICNHLRWMQSVMPFLDIDRTLLKYPVNFDASVYELFGPLLAGACLHVTESAEFWDISAFVRQVIDARITVVDLVPSMLDALLDDPDFVSCPSLRRVVVGGEELTPRLCERFHARMGAELHNVYGPTEATVGVTWWQSSDGIAPARVPIGGPGWNMQAYVLDRQLEPVPLGVAGQLYVAGDCLARGYVGRPAATAGAFVPDPFAERPGSRMYRTGDLARYAPDGSLEFVGRDDGQLKVLGHRVEPREIEVALERHDAVRSCSVVTVRDVKGRGRLVAHVVARPDPPELWPSLGEYDVYDDLLYYAMTHDVPRRLAYKQAIEQTVAGLTVLDIGTGADAILARLCVDAGATRVYAVERNEDACQRAHQLVCSLGLETRIEVIHGDSTEVTLPEQVDVCVSELLGTIASSEGVIPILNDAPRFLKRGGQTIPRGATTLFAPVSLPPVVAEKPRFNPLPGFYVERVFERAGRRFDLRLCIKDARPQDLLASEEVFESLDFSSAVPIENARRVSFTIERDGRMDGFLLWLKLVVGESQRLDSLHQRLSWLPVFLPTFHPAEDVEAGDVLEVKCARLAGDGPLPDYRLDGVLVRHSGERVTFACGSPAIAATYGGNRFYEELFASFEHAGLEATGSAAGDATEISGDSTGRPEGLEKTLRRYLETELPPYMVPGSILIHQELPRNAAGKLDLRALAHEPSAISETHHERVAPRTAAERRVAEIWRGLLGVARIGAFDNFFELGGDSLLAIQLTSRLRSEFDDDSIPVSRVFELQSVADLAASLEAERVADEAENGRVGALLALVESLPEDDLESLLSEDSPHKGTSGPRADQRRAGTGDG